MASIRVDVLVVIFENDCCSTMYRVRMKENLSDCHVKRVRFDDGIRVCQTLAFGELTPLIDRLIYDNRMHVTM